MEKNTIGVPFTLKEHDLIKEFISYELMTQFKEKGIALTVGDFLTLKNDAIQQLEILVAEKGGAKSKSQWNIGAREIPVEVLGPEKISDNWLNGEEDPALYRYYADRWYTESCEIESARVKTETIPLYTEKELGEKVKTNMMEDLLTIIFHAVLSYEKQGGKIG